MAYREDALPTPDAVHELVHEGGVEAFVQPCERRVFIANDFIRLLCKHLASENPHAVLGDALLPRLIDYELLTGEDGKRTVGFGWFAGGASIRKTLRDVVGAQIASDGTSKSLGPLVIGITGTGDVAQGCLDLLQDLPIHHIGVDQLRSVVTDPNTDLRKSTRFPKATSKGYFLRKDGRAFDHPDYYAHPDQYVSEFYAKVAPYLSLLLHGARCAPAYPRVMTNEQPTTALEIARTLGEGRFACVGDISCDVNGLCGRSDVQLFVASNVLADTERLILPYANATPVDMGNLEARSERGVESERTIARCWYRSTPLPSCASVLVAENALCLDRDQSVPSLQMFF
ncbi:hypothetical protein BD310DRAFT_952348 [Dichomitus squalens]|uniref:Uncharacterized protein n=1 Tax=Dichomitus squalens TaxID=114155 RepID=A0A4Q9PHJ6_9APHY|nr:hypothetical protein BD310DRAFT_952348 [Dichomitus squalens]